MGYRNTNDSAKLSGITNLFSFGDVYPLANTEAKAVQNLYVRLNYNYNHDEYGQKKYKVFPTEAYSKSLIGKILKEYRLRATGGNCLTSANVNSNAGQQIIAQIANATGVSIQTTSEILKQLFYASRDNGSGSISEDILCPGWKQNPTQDQVANYNNQKKLEEAAANSVDECGFFCRVGQSVSDFVGAPATMAKTFSVLVPVTVVGLVGGLGYVMIKKINEVDPNYVIKENGRNARAAAKMISI